MSGQDWRNAPVTQRQRDFLEEHDEQVPETRGEASDIISRIIEAKDDPATPAQKRRLRFYGQDEDVSKKEASEIIELFKDDESERKYQEWKANGCPDRGASSSGCAGGCGQTILGIFIIIIILALVKACGS